MSGDGVPVRVLVVEDESLIALNLEQLLLELGYSVIGPFARADHARLAAENNPPDLAVVDLNLVDGRTGLGLAHHLVGQFGTGVVIATANPEDVRAQSFVVLRKPYSDRAIETALRQVTQPIRGEKRPTKFKGMRVDSGA